MATRKTPSKKIAPAVPVAAATTPVRNSAIPPKPVAKKATPTFEQISVRAYEIWASGKGGSEYENWTRAENELRGL